MSSIDGVMKIDQDGSLWEDQTVISDGRPNFITIRDVFFLGTSLPRTSGLRAETPISFDSQGSRDLISTALVKHLTGLSKRNLDAWASSSNPPMASVSWACERHQDPIFTSTFCLVVDTNPWIIFARDINKEWELACSVQRTTAVRPSPDSFTICSQPQLQQMPQQRPTSRVPYCAICGGNRSKRRRPSTGCDHCWPMTGASGGGQRASPARALSNSNWDDGNAAREQQIAQSILESTHHHATEAYRTTGSTQELRCAQSFSQTISARQHRQGGFP